jgi:hypothetical protein
MINQTIVAYLRAHARLLTAAIPLLFVLLYASGCADYLRRKALEDVAKGWCETIRASQVIPVYPLTEDLRPGDVFLVRYSIATQQDEWKQKGFLALDDFRTRLGYVEPRIENGKPVTPAFPNWFARVYFSGYWVDEFGTGPHPRPRITSPGPITATKDGEKPLTESEIALAKLSQAQAPRAAFPSYSFQVRSGASAGLAIPIQGVPVGLSFMQTGSADGTVTIADAYTYAGDPELLYDLLMTWANNHKDILDAAARQSPDQRAFLRVVTRIYLTGAMAVSLHNSESGGAAGKAGADVAANLFNQDGTFNENYKKLLEALDAQANQKLPFDETAKKYLPGGSVKFAWASSRSVAMNQTFDTPLVVGYLGFDVPVFPGATIGEPDFGYPLPTWSILAERIDRFDQRRSRENRLLEQEMLMRGLIGAANSEDNQRAALVLKRLEEQLGKEDPAFKGLDSKLADAQKPTDPAERLKALKEFSAHFSSVVTAYCTPASKEDRTRRFTEAFDKAFESTRAPAAH